MFWVIRCISSAKEDIEIKLIFYLKNVLLVFYYYCVNILQFIITTSVSHTPVSYTHLDVYKRQEQERYAPDWPYGVGISKEKSSKVMQVLSS